MTNPAPETIAIDPAVLRVEIQYNVANALREDLGKGDWTAQLIAAEAQAQACIFSREDAVLCGTAWVDATLAALDPEARIVWHAADGERISAEQPLCDIHARARALLSAERTALNFLQTLSATATQTRRFVDQIEGSQAKIVDTRKTLPGLRLGQKYAVAAGGGINHRTGLFDGILIKENHIFAAGGITPALARARTLTDEKVFIQIEIETLAELEEALAANARMILLDNMALETLREAVSITAGRAILEASGGVTLDNVRAIADTGIDRISIGGLTKDLQALDLSLRHVAS